MESGESPGESVTVKPPEGKASERISQIHGEERCFCRNRKHVGTDAMDASAVDVLGIRVRLFCREEWRWFTLSERDPGRRI